MKKSDAVKQANILKNQSDDLLQESLSSGLTDYASCVNLIVEQNLLIYRLIEEGVQYD